MTLFRIIFVFTCFVLPFWSTANKANDPVFYLISKVEYQVMLDELGITANSDVNLRPSNNVDLTDGPLIQVLSPNLDDEIIASPMDIEIKFIPGISGSAVDKESLKLLYRKLIIKKDITDDVLARAEFSDNTLVLKGARLPSGKHTLEVVVRDELKNESSKRISVKVEDIEQ